MLSTVTENVQKDHVLFVQYEGREEENQGSPALVYEIFGIISLWGFFKVY